jgi:hypothetical protein
MIVNKDMSYDPSHRRPPRQERWPTATPAGGWASYRDGEQEDLRYGAQRAAAGYRQQAVATAAYPAVTNDYDWRSNGYTGTADGYAGAADDFDRVDDGYGRAGYGYARASVGYVETDDGYSGVNDGHAGADDGYGRADDGYAGADDGYGRADDGYAGADDGYGRAHDGFDWAAQAEYDGNGYGGPAHGYAEAADGYGGGAYLGPGSYVEPDAVLTDDTVFTDNTVFAGNTVLTAPDAGVHPDRWQAEQERRREARRRGPMVGAVTGFLAIGVVIGVSTLAAALLKSAISPAGAMGAVFIGRTPAALRNAVLHHFGAQGRTVLLLGMYVTFALVAIVIGMVARRDAAAAVAGVATFTLFAVFVVITRPASHVADVVPAVIGGLAGAAAVLWLFRASAPQLAHGPSRAGPVRHGHGGTRRRTR